MILSILGPQGSGKGTQAAKLVDKYNLNYIDVGATLREMAKADPEIDLIVNKRGELLPDHKVFEIVTRYLNERQVNDNMLFDGYPRSVEQYNLINSYLSGFNKKLEKVIFLTIPDEISVQRLSARRIHKVTGEIYNLITNPPPAGTDPTMLEQRQDDTPQAISERLAMYHKQTQPLIEYLKTQGLVVEVDGTADIETVFEQICQKLN
jgi:adenylate kinase